MIIMITGVSSDYSIADYKGLTSITIQGMTLFLNIINLLFAKGFFFYLFECEAVGMFHWMPLLERLPLLVQNVTHIMCCGWLLVLELEVT